jgi:hypothetical protein
MPVVVKHFNFHILIMEKGKSIDLMDGSTVTAGLSWTFPRGSIDMGLIQ